MRKVIVGAQISLDGVMQSPGGSTEDPTKGFRFGGWSMAYFDEAVGSAPHAFKLTSSRVSPSGVIVSHYQRDGAVRTKDVALGPPSDREIARRERMKREG